MVTGDLTDQRGEDDGTDPRRFHDRRGRHAPFRFGPPAPGRKALQLCGQVKDVLTGLLPECGDEAVRDLTVVAVEPAPHAGRLMVTVAGPVPTDVADRAAITERLVAVLGWVRQETAAAIHRRKAPEIVFRVI